MSKDNHAGMDYYEYKRRQEQLRHRAMPEPENEPIVPARQADASDSREAAEPEQSRKAGLNGIKKLIHGFAPRKDDIPEEDEAEDAPEALQDAPADRPETSEGVVAPVAAQDAEDAPEDADLGEDEAEEAEPDVQIDNPLADAFHKVARLGGALKQRIARAKPAIKLHKDEPEADEPDDEPDNEAVEPVSDGDLGAGESRRARKARLRGAGVHALSSETPSAPQAIDADAPANEPAQAPDAPTVLLADEDEGAIDGVEVSPVAQAVADRAEPEAVAPDDEPEDEPAPKRRARVKDEDEDEDEEEPQQTGAGAKLRRFFSMGAPLSTAANEASDDDDLDDAPRKHALFGRKKWVEYEDEIDEDEYDEDADDLGDDEEAGDADDLSDEGDLGDDAGADEAEEASMTKLLSETNGADEPEQGRRARRRSAQTVYARETYGEPEAPDAAPALPDAPADVDEPTQKFKPVRKRSALPLTDEDDEYDDEEDARPARGLFGRKKAAPPVDEGDDYDDEYDDEEDARPARGLFGRKKAAPPVDEGDDYDDEYDDEEDARPARGLFGRKKAAPPVDEDDDYDEYDDEDDRPARASSGRKKAGTPEDRSMPVGRTSKPKKRVYVDDDLSDEELDDEDVPYRARNKRRVHAYDDDERDYGDYSDDDDYDDDFDGDEDERQLSLGKRFLRFLKRLGLVVLIVLIVVLALRQLESNGRISLSGLRATVGTFLPVEWVFPAPQSLPQAQPEKTAEPAQPESAAPQTTDEGSLFSGALTDAVPEETDAPAAQEQPPVTAQPTAQPAMGVALDDVAPTVTATGATAEFVDEVAPDDAEEDEQVD